ncbi:hypothetical protein EV363DRAFT_80368 [Boletus edulis]|nr:hypothetical protein EV363DRAFT_80368 [Boletus edulis]
MYGYLSSARSVSRCGSYQIADACPRLPHHHDALHHPPIEHHHHPITITIIVAPSRTPISLINRALHVLLHLDHSGIPESINGYGFHHGPGLRPRVVFIYCMKEEPRKGSLNVVLRWHGDVRRGVVGCRCRCWRWRSVLVFPADPQRSDTGRWLSISYPKALTRFDSDRPTLGGCEDRVWVPCCVRRTCCSSLAEGGLHDSIQIVQRWGLGECEDRVWVPCCVRLWGGFTYGRHR